MVLHIKTAEWTPKANHNRQSEIWWKRELNITCNIQKHTQIESINLTAHAPQTFLNTPKCTDPLQIDTNRTQKCVKTLTSQPNTHMCCNRKALKIQGTATEVFPGKCWTQRGPSCCLLHFVGTLFFSKDV